MNFDTLKLLQLCVDMYFHVVGLHEMGRFSKIYHKSGARANIRVIARVRLIVNVVA